jgi:hypothetical protein
MLAMLVSAYGGPPYTDGGIIIIIMDGPPLHMGGNCIGRK